MVEEEEQKEDKVDEEEMRGMRGRGDLSLDFTIYFTVPASGLENVT